MNAKSPNHSEKFALTLALLSAGYLFLRIGMGLFAS